MLRRVRRFLVSDRRPLRAPARAPGQPWLLHAAIHTHGHRRLMEQVRAGLISLVWELGDQAAPRGMTSAMPALPSSIAPEAPTSAA